MAGASQRKYPREHEDPQAPPRRDPLAEQPHVLEKTAVKGKPPKIQREPLEPRRVRRIPAEGFSWIDRRFVREGFIDRLPPEAILLYFFLVAVSDARGLSFYSEATISRILKLDCEELTQARARLASADLILYRHPLYQVLALPEKREAAGAFRAHSPALDGRSGGFTSLSEILKLAREKAGKSEEQSAEALREAQVPQKRET